MPLQKFKIGADGQYSNTQAIQYYIKQMTDEMKIPLSNLQKQQFRRQAERTLSDYNRNAGLNKLHDFAKAFVAQIEKSKEMGPVQTEIELNEVQAKAELAAKMKDLKAKEREVHRHWMAAPLDTTTRQAIEKSNKEILQQLINQYKAFFKEAGLLGNDAVKVGTETLIHDLVDNTGDLYTKHFWQLQSQWRKMGILPENSSTETNNTLIEKFKHAALALQKLEASLEELEKLKGQNLERQIALVNICLQAEREPPFKVQLPGANVETSVSKIDIIPKDNLIQAEQQFSALQDKIEASKKSPPIQTLHTKSVEKNVKKANDILNTLIKQHKNYLIKAGVLKTSTSFDIEDVMRGIQQLPLHPSGLNVQAQARIVVGTLNMLEEMRKEGINAGNLEQQIKILNDQTQENLTVNKTLYQAQKPTQPDNISKIWQQAQEQLNTLNPLQAPQKEPWSQRVVPNFLRKKVVAKPELPQTTSLTPPPPARRPTQT